MSLQFIFGNSGSGKSRYLYETIIKESTDHPENTYIVLVPEQFTMQTQKDLCMLHPRKGIMNIDVLSFVRLSHRVFEEVGRETKRVLDDEGKNLILRKIAGMCEEDLRVLRGNLKKQGYISEVKSVISEFTQYGIGYEKLEEFIGELEPKSYLYYKLEDIRKIYEGFEQYLADRYITKEELLDVLSEAVPESEVLRDSVVVLDGFTGFTPVQNRLLGELMKVCEKVMITVEMDRHEDPFVYRHPYQLFALSKQLTTSLIKIAQENRTEIEDPVYLYAETTPRFENNPALGFLETQIFRFEGKQYPKEQDAVHICSLSTPKEEAKAAAAEIRRLVREKGYRYRDIGVITSDMQTYASYLEKACDDFRIPVFMDHKKSILLNAFVEYLRSLLKMAEQDFSYESVFRYLRTGLAGFDRDEVDRMENYVVALGIRGYKKWQRAWIRRTKQTGEEELAYLNSLRVRFVEKVDGLVLILKQRSKTVRDITLAVYEYIAREHMQEKIREMEEMFQTQGELALAKEYSQVYRIVIELFDKFTELLGEEKVSLKEYCELLDAGLEEAKVGVIPPSLDQVVIGDMERTRLNHLKVLLFVGANDVFLPGSLAQSGFLSERDRELFSGKNMPLSPGAKEKAYMQKFYLYMNLTKPSDRLILSYAKVSADGKALRPAYLIQDIKRLYPKLVVQEPEMQPLSGREMTYAGGSGYLAAGLRDRATGLSEEWKEVYSWYKKNGGDTKKLLSVLLDAAFYKKEPGHLTKEMVSSLFGTDSDFSVTRLERFAACAYAHFLTYGLRLSEREEYKFEAMDLGNIAHQSMERFARKADEKRLDWTEMTEEVREKIIEESVEESIVDYGNTVLYSSARNAYMIIRIKNLIRRSVWALTCQMAQGDFRPSGYEMNFGRGKIDRIDTCEDEDQVMVKVTDYKTGMKAFDITAFYHGLQLQLPVYLNAAIELQEKKERQRHLPEKKVIPAGIFYYRMRDPIVDKEKDEQVLEKKLLKELRPDGIVNAEEAVLKHLEKNLQGNSCYLPVSRNKDGSLSRNSKALTSEEFDLFLSYTKRKEEELKNQIREGNAQAAPYELGGSTGCDYCAYRAVCGFDIRMEGCEYHVLEKYTKEEVMQRLKDIFMEEENNGQQVPDQTERKER